MVTPLQMPPIIVTLPAALPPLSARAQRIIQERIGTGISELLDDLGIDPRPEVQLEVRADTDGSESVSVHVAGTPARFPKEILAEAVAYVNGVTEVAEEPDEGLAALRPESSATSDETAARLGDVLANVCYSAVSTRAELLFAADDRTGARELDGVGEEPTTVQAVKTIDVHVEQRYLSLLIADLADDDLFPFMRSGLFDELGLSLPPFHIVPDSSLRPRGFTFRINAIRTLPRIGLPDETILVNDTPERLAAHGFDGVATLNPATWKPAALTDRSNKESLEELGFTTWDAWDFLILSFAAALRNNAHQLITSEVAKSMLSQLRMAFPALVKAADAHVPIDVMSSVFRELLHDGVSIRNLRRIVELLLYYETVVEREPSLDRMSFVRAGMADAIAHRLSRGTSTVVVYLLDPEIERAILQPELDRTIPEQLLAAVRDEVAQLPRAALTPSILSQAKARSRVRELLRDEFPYIQVVGYGELPPSCNIQPIARLSLPRQPGAVVGTD